MKVNWHICVVVVFFASIAEARFLQGEEAIHKLLSDDEVEQVFGTSQTQVPEYDVVHPVLLDHQGSFLSHDVTHDNKRPASKNLHFGVSAFGKRYHLNMKLSTDRFLAPNFVTEIRKDGKSRYDRSVDACHYIGHVETDQGPGDKAALSNCDGLTGVIQSKKGILMIKPLPKRLGLDKRTHVAYLGNHGNIDEQLGMNVRSLLKTNRQRPSDVQQDSPTPEVVSDVQQDTLGPYYIETLIVTDYRMYKKYKNETKLKNYVLLLLNVVHMLFKDRFSGADINFMVNRFQILTSKDELDVVKDPSKTLKNFCEWSRKQKEGLNDSDDRFFDNAVLLTRIKFCPKKGKCGSVLGLAPMGGMCSKKSSCVINHENGLSTSFTIANEIAHNLNASHDINDKDGCKNLVNVMASTYMATKYLAKTYKKWSSCSRKRIIKFLSGNKSSCLSDYPEKSVKIPKEGPGYFYSLDEQCKITGKYRGLCPGKSNLKVACIKLRCEKHNGHCEFYSQPAAEGSMCGSDNLRKFCQFGKCVPQHKLFGGIPKQVDGGFSDWSSWSQCSHTCGGGVVVRTRRCDNPKPINYGKPCSKIGLKEFKYCASQACPSSLPDPRKTACESQGSTWTYNPKRKVPSSERCILACEILMTNLYVPSTFGPVKNGLKCAGDGYNGVCTDGVCKQIGCDNKIDSKAKLDQCGVCNGDGKSCKIARINKSYNQAPDYYGDDYQNIGILPIGARDIVIEEQTDSINVLALTVIRTISLPAENLLNMGRSYYTSNVNIDGAGTKFHYSVEGYKEKIHAKGPLTRPVEIKFLFQDYSDGKANKYHVNYFYKLRSQATASNDENQDSPRWSTKEWGECSKQCNDGSLGHQSREVFCVMISDGEEEPVDDSDCTEPKPSSVQDCGYDECPAEWVLVNLENKCSSKCGEGVKKGEVICQKITTSGEKKKVADTECPGDDKPSDRKPCYSDEGC